MYIHIDTLQDFGLRMLVQQSHRQLALLRFAATTITTTRTATISNERAARQLGGWLLAWVGGFIGHRRLADNCLTLGSCFICAAHVGKLKPPVAHWFGLAKSDKQKSGDGRGESRDEGRWRRKCGRGRETIQNWKRARGWLQPSGRTISLEWLCNWQLNQSMMSTTCRQHTHLHPLAYTHGHIFYLCGSKLAKRPRCFWHFQFFMTKLQIGTSCFFSLFSGCLFVLIAVKKLMPFQQIFCLRIKFLNFSNMFLPFWCQLFVFFTGELSSS